MFLIAYRNLLQEKAKLIISLAGVAFAVILMFTLIGIYNGASAQFTQFSEKSQADIVIAKSGITDFFHGISLIPEPVFDQLQKEPSVEDAVPMIAQRSFVEREGKKYDLFVTSFFSDKAQGAPWELSQGTLDLTQDEIVISNVLAKKLDVSLGDNINVNGQQFRIAGLAKDASAFGTHYSWVTFEKAKAMAVTQGVFNYVYLTAIDKNNTERLATSLATKYPELSVLTQNEFVNNNRAELEESFLPIVEALVIIGFLIGVLVIGLTVYTSTIDKSREYGVLKAVGINNRQLYGIVLMQALITTMAGLLLGMGLSAGINRLLAYLINITPILSYRSLLIGCAAVLGMGAMASLVPIRRLVKIDPSEVFKS